MCVCGGGGGGKYVTQNNCALGPDLPYLDSLECFGDVV